MRPIINICPKDEEIIQKLAFLNVFKLIANYIRINQLFTVKRYFECTGIKHLLIKQFDFKPKFHDNALNAKITN